MRRSTADPDFYEAHHGLIRALRDAGRLEQSIAAALALTALTPNDPLAHTAFPSRCNRPDTFPEAEAAAARARILEWKAELQSPPAGDHAVKKQSSDRFCTATAPDARSA